jgi:hypothetical protein
MNKLSQRATMMFTSKMQIAHKPIKKESKMEEAEEKRQSYWTKLTA